MVALDTSAIIAILAGEPEQEAFRRVLASGGAKVGAPTLVEARLVLQGKILHQAEALLRAFIERESMTIVPFDTAMFDAAIDAFARFERVAATRPS